MVRVSEPVKTILLEIAAKHWDFDRNEPMVRLGREMESVVRQLIAENQAAYDARLADHATARAGSSANR